MIKIYTTPTCTYCFTLKEFLKEHNIDFQEIDVARDAKTRDEMIEKSGQMEVPVAEIDGEIIVGFDLGKIKKSLKIK